MLLLAFALVGVHALLEYPLDHAYFLLPWGLVIGMATGRTRGAFAREMKGPAFGLLVACVSLTAAWVAAEYVVVERAARSLRFQLAGIGSLPGTKFVEPPHVVLLDGLREFHRMAATSARPHMPLSELSMVRAVVDRYPNRHFLLRRALAMAMNGSRDEAERSLAQLCGIYGKLACDEARGAWLTAMRLHPGRVTEPPEIRKETSGRR